MNDEAETKAERRLRTLRLGTVTRSTESPPRSRSGLRPAAPGLACEPEPSGFVRAALGVEPPPRPVRRLRTPLDEVNEVLRRLEIRELGDVLVHAHRLLAARGKTPDPDVISSLLSVLGRLHVAYRNASGVPLPIVRGALPDVPRSALDDALREAEARGMVRLVSVSPLSPFIEKAAGIHDPRRGLLYYCAPPDPGRER